MESGGGKGRRGCLESWRWERGGCMQSWRGGERRDMDVSRDSWRDQRGEEGIIRV